jgi:hypothetical protein
MSNLDPKKYVETKPIPRRADAGDLIIIMGACLLDKKPGARPAFNREHVEENRDLLESEGVYRIRVLRMIENQIQWRHWDWKSLLGWFDSNHVQDKTNAWDVFSPMFSGKVLLGTSNKRYHRLLGMYINSEIREYDREFRKKNFKTALAGYERLLTVVNDLDELVCGDNVIGNTENIRAKLNYITSETLDKSAPGQDDAKSSGVAYYDTNDWRDMIMSISARVDDVINNGTLRHGKDDSLVKVNEYVQKWAGDLMERIEKVETEKTKAEAQDDQPRIGVDPWVNVLIKNREAISKALRGNNASETARVIRELLPNDERYPKRSKKSESAGERDELTLSEVKRRLVAKNRLQSIKTVGDEYYSELLREFETFISKCIRS